MPIYEHPDDLPPEDRALSEFLRQRAEAMGCECRPVVNVDRPRSTVVIEHHPLCPAWRHPAAGAPMN